VLPRRDGTAKERDRARYQSALALPCAPNIKLSEGRWFQPGQREVVVSKSIHARFAQSNVGDTMRSEKASGR